MVAPTVPPAGRASLWRAALLALAALALALVIPASAAATPSWTAVGQVSAPSPYVPGVIDADSGRILFVDTRTSSARARDFRVMNRQTGQVTPVALTGVVRKAFLTPHGVIVLADDPNSDLSDRLWEWRDGTLVNLGSASRLVYKTPFAAWNGGAPSDNQLFRRDLRTGTNVTVSTTAANYGFDVAPNGDVAFASPVGSTYHVFRYRDGVTKQVSATFNQTQAELDARTDGTQVLYRRGPCCQPGNDLNAEVDEREQTYGPTTAPSTDPYIVAGGWSAFVRALGGDNRQVVLRKGYSRDDTVVWGGHQTASGLPRPAALSPNGEGLMIDTSGGPAVSYLVRAEAPANTLNPPQVRSNGRGSVAEWADWADGAWYAGMGGTLYRLTSNYVGVINSTPGLLAWWRLNESGGTVAKDVQGNHPGTYAGDVTPGGGSGAVAGDSDPGAEFGGTNGRVKVPSLGSYTSFTIEAWVRYSPTLATEPANPYDNNGVFGGPNSVRLITRANAIYADLLVDGQKRGVMQVGRYRNEEAWTHLVLVRNGSSMLLYRNGIVASLSNDVPSTPTNLVGSIGAIGSPTGTPSYPFRGTIDEVAVFDRALSSQTVQEHYRAGWG